MSEIQKQNSSVYDNAMRTAVEKCPHLLVPLVNEIFKADYELDAEVTLLHNEFFFDFARGEKIITDAHFKITSKSGKSTVYHLESQSNTDSFMSLRMAEYDLAIGMHNRIETDEEIIIKLPKSSVLWLRGASPMKRIVFELNKNRIAYTPTCIQMKTYTLDDIVKKKLYILLPFYQFNLEEIYDKYGKSPEDNARVIELINEMSDMLENSDLKSFDMHALFEIMLNVFSMLAKNNAKLKAEGESIMGGRVMRLKIDDIVDQNKALGKAEGIMEEKIRSAKNFIDKGLTTLSKLKDSGLYTDDELKAIANS